MFICNGVYPHLSKDLGEVVHCSASSLVISPFSSHSIILDDLS